MLAAIVPPDVVVAEVFDDQYDYDELFSAEAAAIEGAAPKRRREFTAARRCARVALLRAGLPPEPILRGPSGAPRWPAGVVGSITHCEGYRACAIGSTNKIAAIGIDAEPHDELPDGVLPIIASEPERATLAQLATDVPRICWDKILFSAKESVYKAWFPAARQWLGFENAAVTIEPGGAFSARLLVPGLVLDGERHTTFHGRWMVRHGLIVTALTVPAVADRP